MVPAGRGLARVLRSLCALGLAALAACSIHRPDPMVSRTLPTRAVSLDAVPFFPQERYQCGPAALATVLQGSGLRVTPAELEDRIYLPERRGSLQTELIAAARRYGRMPYRVDPELSAILDELYAGHPVLVLQNLGVRSYALWHYAVVVGYRPRAGELVLRSGRTRRLSMDITRFAQSWADAGHWGLVVLEPGVLPARPDARRYLAAAAALEEVGQMEAASAAYRRAASRWPGDAVAWLGLGNAHFMSGDYGAARQAFVQALALDPGNLAAENNLALSLSRLGCRGLAAARVDAALSEDPRPALRAILLDTRREIAGRPAVEGVSCAP